MNRLREEILRVLKRITQALPSGGGEKLRIVYTINNCEAILTAFADKGVRKCADFTALSKIVSNQVSWFVEKELGERFGALIAFTRQCEETFANHERKGRGGKASSSSSSSTAALESSSGDVKGGNPKIDLKKAIALATRFKRKWKSSMDEIDKTVMSLFASGEVGGKATTKKAQDVLKQVLIQLVFYYQRFQMAVAKAVSRKPSAFTKEVVPESIIMMEVRKYGNRR